MTEAHALYSVIGGYASGCSQYMYIYITLQFGLSH